MASGIYLLRFSGTNRVYVGQSINLNSRRSDHLRNLKNGTASLKLKEAYHLYGPPSFEIILECPIAELDACENEAILIWDSVNSGFNTLSTAQDAPIAGHPGDLHWNSTYSNTQILALVDYILDNPAKPLRLISSDLNVSYLVVKDVAGGTKHKWLASTVPNKYKLLLDMIGTRPTSMGAKDRGITYPDIVSPTGVTYTITNLNVFAREHNLNSGGLYKLLTGTAKTCKGFKLLT